MGDKIVLSGGYSIQNKQGRSTLRFWIYKNFHSESKKKNKGELRFIDLWTIIYMLDLLTVFKSNVHL